MKFKGSTGRREKLCVHCGQRAVFSSRLRRWLHVRPSSNWHRAEVEG